MNALRMRLRSEFRAKWRGWLGLALMIGVFGGATLGTVAGARRTDSAYPRFLRETNPFDQFLLGIAGFSSSVPVTKEDLIPVPQVDTVIDAVFLPRADGQELFGSADPRIDRSFNGVKVVTGRLPVREDEIGVPVAVADRLHLHPGSTLTIPFLEASESGEPKPFPVKMTVAGIIAVPGEFPPESDLGPPRLHVTSAFVRANSKRILMFNIHLVWLKHHDQDLPAFREALRVRFGGRPVIGYTQQALTKNVERSFHLQAVSLQLFAACLAVVTLLVLGQALGRQSLTEGIDYPALRALGLNRSQLFSLGMTRAVIVAGGGVLLSIPIGFLLSPLAPRGLARAAEPSPGFAFDATALGLGALVTILVLLAFAAVPARRAARLAAGSLQSETIVRPTAARRIATQTGAPAPAVIGLGLALEPGRGRTAVPVRTTIVGVSLAIAALVVSLAFGDSLRHLLATPRLYGVTWGAQFQWEGDESDPAIARQAIARVKEDPAVDVAEFGGGGIPFLVNGVQADGLVLQAGHPTFLPVILRGRAPRTGTEILLGPKTLERIHRDVGDQVLVGPVGVAPTRMIVVGRAVLPTAGHTANLGEGSLVTFEGLHAFDPSGPQEFRLEDSDNILVRFHAGMDQAAATRRITKNLEDLNWGEGLQNPPADLLNFGRSKNLPLVLSGMLGLLALATLAHALFTSITRRRRDLAILKTLGFTRGETRRTVAWQSTTLVIVALACGLAVGSVAGRWLWTRYATDLGIVPEARLPALTLVAIVPIGILIANALALFPARTAARTRPALVLRTE